MTPLWAKIIPPSNNCSAGLLWIIEDAYFLATYTIIRLNPGFKRKDISTISGKSLPTIARHIDVLTEDGLIEYRGSRKTGGYYAK